MNEPVARWKFTNIWSCSHGSVKRVFAQVVRRAAVINVGTDLIGRHPARS